MNPSWSNNRWLPIAAALAAMALLVILALGLGSVLAQEPEPAGELGALGGSPVSAVTYQGRLQERGQPANGLYDFEFYIWDAASSGSWVASCANCWSGHNVENGLFTLDLIPSVGSFGEAFNGPPRWLEIRVRPTGTVTYTSLGRQAISPVPYAWSLYPGAVINGGTGSSPVLTVQTGGTSGAVYGHSNTTDGIGVVGTGPGYSTGDLGGYWKPGGLFGGRNGVVGISKAETGYGVAGITQADFGYGVVGIDQSPSGGWAGRFIGGANGNGVWISTPVTRTGLSVVNGAKSAVVRTDDGSRLLYTEESSEVWFTDYGFGALAGGSITVTIDPLFAQTVNLEEPYHVFLQAYGDATLYVSNRTATSFEVWAHEGDPDVEFSYRLVARRLGYEDDRLERAPWADNDPNLYPERAQSASLQQEGQP